MGMASEQARRFYDTEDPLRCGRTELPYEAGITRHWLERVPAELQSHAVVELGCGRGALAGVSPSHAGFDLSLRAVLSNRSMRATVADMEHVPLRDGAASFVFSWAAIEHVPHPERVMIEVERILTPGGIALLAPAWHCRTWAAEGLEFRPYRELRPIQRLRKALIPVRNSLVVRGPGELATRLRRELQLLRGTPLPFTYERLQPNLESYVGTDSDAFTSLDPHQTIAYFLSRGWTSLSHPSRRSRMFSTHEPVVVQKPA